jgi:hypothetical protein
MCGGRGEKGGMGAVCVVEEGRRGGGAGRCCVLLELGLCPCNAACCCCMCVCVCTQVNIGLRVLTRPNPEKLPQLYRTLGQVRHKSWGGVKPGFMGGSITLASLFSNT